MTWLPKVITGKLPWHVGAHLVDKDDPNPYRRYRFLGRMTQAVSFFGELYWKEERVLGNYDHETDFWAQQLLREIDLREAAYVGLFP